MPRFPTCRLSSPATSSLSVNSVGALLRRLVLSMSKLCRFIVIYASSLDLTSWTLTDDQPCPEAQPDRKSISTLGIQAVNDQPHTHASASVAAVVLIRNPGTRFIKEVIMVRMMKI